MNRTLKSSIVFVLIGIDLAWLGLVGANYLGLFEETYYDKYGNLSRGIDSLTKGSTYIFLFALVALAVFSGLAYRRADQEVAKKTQGSLPVFRFTTTAVIVSLVSLAIFAITAFLASFNDSQGTHGLVDQLVGVYLPIVLAAAGCVVLLLSATVYRKSEVQVAEVTKEQKRAKREAALAFVYPIVGTTIALIIGIAIYTASRENPQVWVWVLILAIVGGSVAMGSIYAARTKASSARASVTPKKTQGTAALSLNFVLVVVFVVVVTLMSFSFGIGAIQELRQYRISSSSDGGMVIDPITLEWFVRSMLPAILILVLVNITTYIAVRIRSIIAAE